MSKYEEICKSYADARRAFRDYQTTCRDFARDLIYGMIDYFEWPQDQEITYIPLGEEISPNDRFYAIAGAMRMDDHAFWHFGVELTVRESATSGHPTTILMSFFIKKTGSHFIVKLGGNGREIKIHENRKNDLDPFFDAVFKQIVDFFKRGYIDAVTNQGSDLAFIKLSGKSATNAAS
ncbi:MAG: hypothetical protein AAF490_17435 [Chloroflexota bacterium]